MMGAAMLKHHQFVRSLLESYRVPCGTCTWGSQAQPSFLLNNVSCVCVLFLNTMLDLFPWYIFQKNEVIGMSSFTNGSIVTTSFVGGKRVKFAFTLLGI